MQRLAAHSGACLVFAGALAACSGDAPTSSEESLPTLRPQAATAQGSRWTRQFGSVHPDMALGVAVRGNGVYLSGRVGGSLDGQPYGGGLDAFVRRYDAHGAVQWTRQFGVSDAGNEARAIAVDASGIYVVGLLGGYAVPGQVAYLRKYDFDGNEVFTRQFVGANQPNAFVEDAAMDVELHGGAVYVTGFTSGTMPGQSSAGGLDAWLRKYDLAGNELWTRQFGTSGTEIANGLSADETGLYVAGHTDGVLGPASAGANDIFVRKFSFDGTEMWTRQFGSSDSEAWAVIAAGSNGIYVGGFTFGALPGQLHLGSADGFVRHYDADGNEGWTHQFGYGGFDQVNAIALHGNRVYVGGSGFLIDPPGPSPADAFVRAYNSDGTERCTRQFGTSDLESVGGLAAAGGGVYVAGSTAGTLSGQTSAGGDDAFLVKLGSAAFAHCSP